MLENQSLNSCTLALLTNTLSSETLQRRLRDRRLLNHKSISFIASRETRNWRFTRKNKEVSVVENQPCKLSFEKLNAVVQTGTAAKQTQGTKLFIAPEIKVKPGSKIIVEQNGVTTEYSASGVPAVYPSHVEIKLELLRGWASWQTWVGFRLQEWRNFKSS